MKFLTLCLGILFAFSVCEAPADTVTKPTHITINPATGGSCLTGVTSGTLFLKVSQPRAAGVSPFLAFFNATATTDSTVTGSMTVFQDTTITWNFGDSLGSGSGTWAYGARPNTNSRNTASGGIAAHLYITAGSDTAPTVTVIAKNGVDTATCTMTETVTDPTSAAGFPTTATTCVASGSTPVAGSGGCPTGAAVLNQSNFNTALSGFANGKRFLFKCGDTFTGTDKTLNAVKAAVGAYGGCQGTQSGRPILATSSTSSGALMVANTAGDISISDLDCEGGGSGAACVSTPGGIVRVPYQITMSNLKSAGNHSSYAYGQCAQCGLVAVVQTGATGIGTFMNFLENNPASWAGNTYNNVDYQALLGSSITGVGCCSISSGIEVVRISACRLCALENNTITDANNVGAVLKLHNGNTNNSLTTWTGVYTELVVISDNFFGGNSGGQLAEIAPQNGGLDERLRNILVERNMFKGSTQAQGGVLVMVSAQNVTLRDNVLDMLGPDAFHYPILGIQGAKRGSGNIIATNLEVYNNTCYAPGNQPNQTCIGFDTIGSRALAASNSIARNNLYYVSSASGKSVVDNTGSGNTVSDNSPNIALNPAFTNASGNFSLPSDFKPTANYTGAATILSVLYDGLNVLWSGTYSLGAIKP